MELKNFISSHDVDMASERIDNNTMFEMSSLLSFDFGTELVTYIQKYGYLGYRYVEFCGINARQMERSDMVKQTLALRARCPQTDKYVVLESVGDGFYVLVDEEDAVYDFDEDSETLTPTGKALNDYILERFQAAD